MKNSFSLALIIGALLNVFSTYAICPDLSVEEIEITNVLNFTTHRTVSYTFTVKNVGDTLLNLNDYTMQNYEYADSVFSRDYAAGGVSFLLFTGQDSILNPNNTFTYSWSANMSTESARRPFLITYIYKSRGGQDECSQDNNYVIIKTFDPPSCADLTVEELVITNIQPNTSGRYVSYTFTLKNSGFSPLNLNDYALQNYENTDSIFANDFPSGGVSLSALTGQDSILNPNETFTGSYSAGISLESINRPYLISYFHTYIPPKDECSLDNNYIITRTYDPLSTNLSPIPELSGFWSETNNSYHIIGLLQQASYVIFNMQGVQVQSGLMQPGQDIRVKQDPAIYILIIHAEQQVISEQVLVH